MQGGSHQASSGLNLCQCANHKHPLTSLKQGATSEYDTSINNLHNYKETCEALDFEKPCSTN